MNEYCSECGSRLKKEDLFCAECGTKVQSEEIEIKVSSQKDIIPKVEIQRDDNVKKDKVKTNNYFRSYSLKTLLIAFIFISLGGLIFYLITQRSNERIEAINKLDQVELKIREAIQNKNYDYALILIEQLTYSIDLNDEENQKLAQQYEDKRNSLKSIILTLKQDKQSTSSNYETAPHTFETESTDNLTPISTSQVENLISDYIHYLNSKNIDGLLSCYANTVDYYGKSSVDKGFIEKDKNIFYNSWDKVNYWLIENSLYINDLSNNSKLARFEIGYSVYSTKSRKSSEGTAENTFRMRKGIDGLEIYEENQKIISRNNGENNGTITGQEKLPNQVNQLNEPSNNKVETDLKSSKEQSPYLVAVDEMPEPIGGIAAIQSKIVYPEIAKRAGVEGKVYILAFVDENGNVTKAQVLKGLGAGLDEAALDAIRQTKFKPGKLKGVPVKVQISIPLVFKLN